MAANQVLTPVTVALDFKIAYYFTKGIAVADFVLMTQSLRDQTHSDRSRILSVRWYSFQGWLQIMIA
jgi:hypothetical protein